MIVYPDTQELQQNHLTDSRGLWQILRAIFAGILFYLSALTCKSKIGHFYFGLTLFIADLTHEAGFFIITPSKENILFKKSRMTG